MINILPLRGTYTLIIFLSKQIRIEIGQLGVKGFVKGYYTYTGSALGTGASSLRRRVSRHLRKTSKKKYWHIDFLLTHRDATVIAIVAAQTDRKKECELNGYIKRRGGAGIPISGFGSSDCNRNCQSHLLYFGEDDVERKIVEFYAEKLGSRPVVIDFCKSLPSFPEASNFSLSRSLT
jgi:Uri superfamily endonuclease